MPILMDDRIYLETFYENNNKNVLYLSQRDQRVNDNHSLNFSISLALNSKSNIFVGSVLYDIKMNERQSIFIQEGLILLQEEYKRLNIEFIIIDKLEDFIMENSIDRIITEFSPLREVKSFHERIKNFAKKNKLTFQVCDSHNIIPCSALKTYTRTPKSVKSRLYKLWTKYYKPIPKAPPAEYNNIILKNKDNSYHKLSKDKMKSSDSVFKGGTENGLSFLENFIDKKLKFYKKNRNKPIENCISNLSPWIHTGQLGMMTILQRLHISFSSNDENLLCFIDELFGWKQIAEHFCKFESNYDNINGALPWAYQTLKLHSSDKREKIYSLGDLENAQTDDDEWNAGQKELLITGKMHGYVRMYWAKKLLYWTESPEKAIEYAIYLNDKYSIDGNDPNGYLGIMWSICGTMDQGWRETDVRGKIRGMSGIKDKKYTEKWSKKDL